MTGVQLIMECLKAHHVTTLFGYPGGTIMPTYDALYDAGLDAINPNDDVYMGMIGMHGTKAANFAVQESDLLLVFCARFDDRVTGKLDTFAPHAKVIHCDIDAAEIHKLRRADIALQGDLIQALNALKQELDIKPWHEQIKDLKAKLDFTYVENQGNRPIDPWALLNSLSNRKLNNAALNRLLNSKTAYLLQVCIPPDECNADMVEEMN